MTFGTPIALLGLLVVPLLIALVVAAERRRGASASGSARRRSSPDPTPPARRIRRLLPLAVALVALSALVVGVARPRAKIPCRGKQATVILALDSSRSMAATDVKPSRLAAAVAAARTFLDAAPKSYSIGVVSFSTRASLVLAPTTDRNAAKAAVDLITLGSGTAIGDAIDRSVAAARPSQPGQPTTRRTRSPPRSSSSRTASRRPATGQPLAAAARAKQQGIPINTIALGTRDAVVEVPRANGVVERVTVVPDTKTLQQIARVTGGRFAAAPTAERLKQIYKDLGSRLARKETREVTAALPAPASCSCSLPRALARMVAEAVVRRSLLALTVALAGALALTAGSARAADECKGLQVCVPVEGPWVTVSSAGADWELPCPLPGYIVGGTDARVTTVDVDVSFRGETGSPVGPGVTTKRSLVFHGVRTGAALGDVELQALHRLHPEQRRRRAGAHRPDGERLRR